MGEWESGGVGVTSPILPLSHSPTLPQVLSVARVRWNGGGAGEGLCCRLAEDHALLTTPPGDGALLATSLEERLSGCAHVTDLTSTLAAFGLAGPRSREVLSKVTPLDLTTRGLSAFTCAQASVAKCHAVLARLDFDDAPAYRIFLTRDYAEFAWDALMEAGHDCGIKPVGTEAWRALAG